MSPGMFNKAFFLPLLSLSQDFEKPLCFSTTFSDGRNFSQDSPGLLEGWGHMLKNDDWCNTLEAFISRLQTSLCPYNTPLYGHEAILDEKKGVRTKKKSNNGKNDCENKEILRKKTEHLDRTFKKVLK